MTGNGCQTAAGPPDQSGPATWAPPLHTARTLAGARRMARVLAAAAARWEGMDAVIQFWVGEAERLLAPLLFIAAVNGLELVDVVRWFSHLWDDRPCEIAELAVLSCHSNDPAVAADAVAASGTLAAMSALPNRAISSIWVTAQMLVIDWREATVAGGKAVVGGGRHPSRSRRQKAAPPPAPRPPGPGDRRPGTEKEENQVTVTSNTVTVVGNLTRDPEVKFQ